MCYKNIAFWLEYCKHWLMFLTLHTLPIYNEYMHKNIGDKCIITMWRV